MLSQSLRPNRLQDVIGQDTNVNIINNWFIEKKVPNVIFLNGESGSGKSTLGYIIAMLLQCENPKVIDGIVTPCHICSHCTDILTRSFQLDTNFIKSAESDKSDIINISEQIKTQSIFSDKSVYIIDESQSLGNSKTKGVLLNLLENSLDDVYFIIISMQDITTDATMKKALNSRVQKLKFKKVKQTVINEYLFSLLEKFDPEEKINIETFGEVLLEISNHCDGSVRQAVQDFDTVISAKAYSIDIARSLFDWDDEVTIMDLYKKVICNDKSFFTQFNLSEVSITSFIKYGIKVFSDYSIRSYTNDFDEYLLKNFKIFFDKISVVEKLLTILLELDKVYVNDEGILKARALYTIKQFMNSFSDNKVSELPKTTTRRMLKS